MNIKHKLINNERLIKYNDLDDLTQGIKFKCIKETIKIYLKELKLIIRVEIIVINSTSV